MQDTSTASAVSLGYILLITFMIDAIYFTYAVFLNIKKEYSVLCSGKTTPDLLRSTGLLELQKLET